VPPAAVKNSLLFLHMPKAGGTALAGALGNRFEAERCLTIYLDPEPSGEELDAARYVTGHVSTSIIERFERPPFSVVVLRDPIERALSLYSFFRELEKPRTTRLALERMVPALRLAKQHSLEGFIKVAPDLAEHYLGNWQARVLGGKSLEGTDERLQHALDGLHGCDFVGLAERQDESVDWLTRRLGWSGLTPLPITNVTRTRLRRDELSPAALDALLELTTVDRELYAEAVRLYERRIAVWAAESDARDDTAGIEDAPLVSDLRFDQPIRGSGWIGREPDADRDQICWIGHTARAQVDLAGDPRARSVAVEIRHVLDPTALQSLRIRVGGKLLYPRFDQSGDVLVASAPIDGAKVGGEATRVELAVDHPTRPCDVDPSSDDNRELAIAVRRIALSR
jgi:hypothetical protein